MQIFDGSFKGTLYFQPFYYVIFLPFIYLFLGKGVWGVLLIQSFIGATTVWLTGITTALVSNKRTGLIAALLLTFYWVHIIYTSYILIATLNSFMIITFTLFSLLALKKKKKLYWLLSGLCCSALVLLRANNFIFVLFNHDGLGDILICVLQEIALLLFSLSSIFYHVFKVLTFGSENYWYILKIILFLLLFVIWGIIRLGIRFEIWIIRLLISHHRIELLFIPVFVNYKYHFIGSKNFDSQHDWCSLLSLENPSLFRWDVKNAAISSLVLNKWDINTWWQVLIQLDKFLFEEEKFLWFRCLFHLS